MRVTGFAALLALAALTVISGVLRRRLAVVTVFGQSMQPTLKAGDRVLVRRTDLSHVRAGQIVVFEMPDGNGTWATEPPSRIGGRREWMIKRAAAVPGDCLPDILVSAVPAMVSQSVPAGNLVVLGDNVANSQDSRAIGYIPAERLLGVMLRPLPRR